MAKELRQEVDGTAVVTEQTEAGTSTWRCRPDQAEKHLATWQAPEAQEKLSPGDASAILDAASDYAKRRAKGEA